MRFSTTFAKRSGKHFSKWKNLEGVWNARDKFGNPSFSVVLAPRVPRKDESEGLLSGFVREGELEGVFWFRGGSGFHIKADDALSRTGARIRIRESGPFLSVGRKSYRLLRKRKINDDMLSRIMIFGHRGLGFEGLDNSLEAMENAWFFGASGLEIDITVPYRIENQRREPQLDRMKVFHPRGMKSTESIHHIPARMLKLDEFFARLPSFGMESVYIDPKVGWLGKPDVRKVFHGIMQRMKEFEGYLSIGAPVDKAAEVLSGGKAPWTLEWTEVKNPGRFFKASGKRPDALSFSLLSISGSIKWPVIEWFFKDVGEEEERMIRRMKRPLVFWTANDPDHFTGSLNAAFDNDRFRRKGETGEIAIMTDYPHRLAYWLACLP
jgi:hypothetical protein